MKVINLPKTPNRSYGEILEIVFRELLEYWSSRVISLSTVTEPEPQAELSLPSSAQSRLAFFSVPTRYAAVYKARIYPIAERYGFSPIMATDVATPGDNLMAKVYALIERSAIVVADLSSPSTMLEVGMALSKEGMAKPLILITENQATVPFDVASHQVIRRPQSLDEESPTFIKAIETAFAEAFSRISPSLEDEPNRLVQKKEYRAAVIAAFSLLELSGLDMFASRSSLGMLLEYAKKEEVFTVKEYQRIRAHMNVRNRIAHTRVEVSAAQAKTIVREIAGATAKLRDANLTRRSSAPTTV